jgi:hypothetical protein
LEIQSSRWHGDRVCAINLADPLAGRTNEAQPDSRRDRGVDAQVKPQLAAFARQPFQMATMRRRSAVSASVARSLLEPMQAAPVRAHVGSAHRSSCQQQRKALPNFADYPTGW